MKKFIFAIVSMAMMMFSCESQQLVENAAENTEESAQVNDLSDLIEKARWGDGASYLKLADCYRDGNGVERDYMCMVSMLALAECYDDTVYIENYLRAMPEDSDLRLVFEAVDLYMDNHTEEMEAKIERMRDLGYPDEFTVRGIIATESGDSVKGKQLLEKAASMGSGVAEILLVDPNVMVPTAQDVERLKTLADQSPLAALLLASIYTGRHNERWKDEELAAYYYLKADEKAFLGSGGANWLLDYHERGGKLKLSPTDLARLSIIASQDMVIEVDTTEVETLQDEVDD